MIEDGYEWGYASEHKESDSRYAQDIKKFIPTSCTCKSYLVGSPKCPEEIKPSRFKHVHKYGQRL